MFLKETISFCSTCYKRIPAKLYIEKNGSVTIKKRCPEHGKTKSMVERNSEYYLQCMSSEAKNIYNGYFIDVTEKCNMNCKYCYFKTSNRQDPSINSIFQECKICFNLRPFILHGGEPTMRDDLPELIEALQKIARVELLTNGSGLMKRFDDLAEHIVSDGMARINLSIHNPKIDIEILEEMRRRKIKIESILWVIDDISQIDEVIDFSSEYADVVESVRIKAATKLWNEQKPESKIFVSDMLNYIKSRYDCEPIWWRNNKTSFFNLRIGTVYYMLVSWYDVENIDILDIMCPPMYRARNGQIENIVTACIINEGMQKGYLNGRKLDHGSL